MKQVEGECIPDITVACLPQCPLVQKLFCEIVFEANVALLYVDSLIFWQGGGSCLEPAIKGTCDRICSASVAG